MRVAWNDAVLLKRLLDIGARSLLMPFVQIGRGGDAGGGGHALSAAGHSRRVGGARANRFGRVAGYLRSDARDLRAGAVGDPRRRSANLEAIAAVEGVDGLFIGPSDLAADLGHLGDAAHPEVQAAIADDLRAHPHRRQARRHPGPGGGRRARYFGMGFSFVAIGSDLGILAAGSTALAARMREAIGEPYPGPAV